MKSNRFAGPARRAPAFLAFAVLAGEAGAQLLSDGMAELHPKHTIHHPYTLPLADRYQFDPASGQHTLQVRRGDPGFKQGDGNAPRCELRFQNDYNSGERLFEGDVYVVAGTYSCIFQIWGSTQSATTLMILSQADGDIVYYDGPQVIRRNAFEKWFNLKVYHNTAGSGTIRIYANDTLVLTVAGRGRTNYYNKAGVYSVRNGNLAETRWRNIRFWGRGPGVSLAISPHQAGQVEPARRVVFDLGRARPWAGGLPGNVLTVRDLAGRRSSLPSGTRAAGAGIAIVTPPSIW